MEYFDSPNRREGFPRCDCRMLPQHRSNRRIILLFDSAVKTNIYSFSQIRLTNCASLCTAKSRMFCSSATILSLHQSNSVCLKMLRPRVPLRFSLRSACFPWCSWCPWWLGGEMPFSVHILCGPCGLRVRKISQFPRTSDFGPTPIPSSANICAICGLRGLSHWSASVFSLRSSAWLYAFAQAPSLKPCFLTAQALRPHGRNRLPRPHLRSSSQNP